MESSLVASSSPQGIRSGTDGKQDGTQGPQLPGCTALLKPELSPASGKVLPRPEVAGNWGMERAPSCGQRADVVGRMGLVFLKPWEGPMVGIRVLAIRESF